MEEKITEKRIFIAPYLRIKLNNVKYGMVSVTAKDKGNALLKMEELLSEKIPDDERIDVNYKNMISVPADTIIREE